MQILAPGNLVHGGIDNNLVTSLNNYGGRVASLQAVAKRVESLLQYRQVLRRGVEWFRHS